MMKTIITNSKAIELVQTIFEKIENSTSVNDLIAIVNSDPLDRYKMDTEQYPAIGFNLTKSEIDWLITNGALNENGDIKANPSISEPLAKLLYALIWKNGDLKKIKHIVKGVLDADDKDAAGKKDGLVFYQFGKHLSNRKEPIIDQHVLRAFALRTAEEADVDEIRNWSVVTKKHESLISEYKAWLAGLQKQFENEPAYRYHVDKALFALGKALKIK